MGNRNRRGSRRDLPPYIDPDFAQALSGEQSGRAHSQRKPDHKTRQLCRQVQRVLNLELSGVGSDPILAGLYVQDVTPAPGATHLLVHLLTPAGCSMLDVLQRIDAIAPRLRAEVARAITRKRAPELSFVPVAPDVEES